jgi:hypothetical protein
VHALDHLCAAVRVGAVATMPLAPARDDRHRWRCRGVGAGGGLGRRGRRRVFVRRPRIRKLGVLGHITQPLGARPEQRLLEPAQRDPDVLKLERQIDERLEHTLQEVELLGRQRGAAPRQDVI